MKRHKKKKVLTWTIVIVAFLLLIVGAVVQQGLTLVPAGNTVWIPDYGTLACKQTRIECTGGACSDTNPTFKDVANSGTSLWCGAPTISDANYYDGCDIYLKTNGGILSSIGTNICNGDGTNCQTAPGDTVTLSWASGQLLQFHLRSGQKLFASPKLFSSPWQYYEQAHVYGIAIEGAVKPQYADRCNVAQLLNDKQIATLKDSVDYQTTIAAGEINPGTFPVVFVTGYRASYSDQRVLTINGASWFVEDVGTRCEVSQDTNGRYIVTDHCVGDDSITCLPNIGNCDKNGHLLAVTGDQATSQKSCVPGTLIGSSTERVPVSATKACKVACDTTGVPKNVDCVDIPTCTNGQVLGQNYDCVDSTKQTAKDACESGGGKFTSTTDKDGNIVTSCDYNPSDNFVLYVIGAVVLVVFLMILIKLRIDESRKK